MTRLLPAVVLAVLALGATCLLPIPGPSDEAAPPRDVPPDSVEGIVTAVDLGEATLDGPVLLLVRSDAGEPRTVAVPTMGPRTCTASDRIADPFLLAVGDRVSVSGAVVEGGRILPCEDPSHHLLAEATVRDAALGYAFMYRKGPDGYVILDEAPSSHPEALVSLTLVDRREHEILATSTGAREGPPSLGVRVYRNPARLSAFVWPDRHPAESHADRIVGDVAEVVVGGANAARYRVDGLYPIEVYVVASGSRVYMITGEFPPEEARMAEDFDDFVARFRFVPAPGQR